MVWNLSIFMVAIALSLGAEAVQSPREVTVAIEKAYLPIGFDDNDRAQVTITGRFPSTCYKVSNVDVVTDAQKRTVTITQRAYLYETGECIAMVVPYTQVVNVGILSLGKYEVKDATSGAVLGSLPVSGAKYATPDDELYAPVTDANLITDESGTKTLTLRGQFMDRCTEFKDVIVRYYPEVIVVQPTVRRTTGRCEPWTTRFMKTVELDSSLKGINLLHVRVMDGQAINKLVDASFIE